MTEPEKQPVIILRRDPGPTDDTMYVLVDYMNFNQASITVNREIVGTPREEDAIRRMLDARRIDIEALREADI